MTKKLVVYASPWCAGSIRTQDTLREWGIEFTRIDIRQDREAAGRVKALTGFESAPTLVIAKGDSLEPFEPPAPLAQGASPRGVDRGSVLSEPSVDELRAWLTRHGLLAG